MLRTAARRQHAMAAGGTAPALRRVLWRVRRRLRRLRTCCLCGAALLLAGAYCSSVFRTAPPLMGDGLCDPPGRCAHGTCDAAGDCVCVARSLISGMSS